MHDVKTNGTMGVLPEFRFKSKIKNKIIKPGKSQVYITTPNGTKNIYLKPGEYIISTISEHLPEYPGIREYLEASKTVMLDGIESLASKDFSFKADKKYVFQPNERKNDAEIEVINHLKDAGIFYHKPGFYSIEEILGNLEKVDRIEPDEMILFDLDRAIGEKMILQVSHPKLQSDQIIPPDYKLLWEAGKNYQIKIVK